MRDLASELLGLTPILEKLRTAGAVLGLSLGVLHEGKVIYLAHFGQREPGKPDPPNDDTIYFTASLTKAVTAAAAAILVEQEVLSWTRPVSEYLPELAERKDELGRSACLDDFLCHRSGLPSMSPFWVQRKQHFMLAKSEVVRTAASFKLAKPFREGFRYCNWGYGLVENVIERATNTSFATFVRDEIFKPLGMERTMIEVPTVSNVTSANTNRDDGSIWPLKLPTQSDQTGLAGAGAMKSSLHDLLILYKAFLTTFSAEKRNIKDASSHLKLVSELFRSRVPINESDMADHGYALGWINTILPHRLGTISMNTIFMDEQDMPVIGTEAPGVRVLHHHGSSLGNLVATYLLPETETAIVVLSNTFGCSDVADWVGQLVLQTVLGEIPHDYVKWINETKVTLMRKYSDTIADLQRGSTDIPPSLDLSAYCGRYVNDLGNFSLNISLLHDNEGLQLRVQEFDDVVYSLLPYNGDTFYWPCNREVEMCDEMMFPWTGAGFHKVKFCVENQKATKAEWELDSSVGIELFMRVEK